MSYSGSGAVATLWSPSNYNGPTKIPVPSTTRRYSTTSSTSAYRSSGSQERSYYSSTTNSYTSASRNVQTEYRSRYTTPIRSSASVPTSYSSRITDLHDTTSRLTNKERSETNDALLNYRRSSKTDNDVAATLEKYVMKSDAYKLRNDAMPSRFLNTSNLDSKFSTNRKLTGSSTLDLSRLNNASLAASAKPPKTGLSSRLQRKDSLTKSDHADSSPVRASLERKISSSAIGGSSSPIEIRKTSEVWDKKLSVSYGENMSRGGVDGEELFHKVDNKTKSGSRENSEDVSDNSIVLENIESEEKTLTFEEIRKKFDSTDSNALKGGFENLSKTSHDEAKASISNGVILGVHNFGQMHYLDRNSKSKKPATDADQGEAEAGEKSDPNTSFSSPQTLRRTVLKPIPSALKNSISNSILRKSPDPHTDVSTSLKKKTPDFKKSPTLSPEKKEAFSTLAKLPAIPAADPDLPEKRPDEGDPRRDTRNPNVTSKLGLDNRSDFRIQPKPRGEKLLSKIEATLLKQPDVDNDVLNTLSRMRRSPETKPKDFENQTKVIELRRLDTAVSSPFEAEGKKPKDQEAKDRLKDKKTDPGKPQTTQKPSKHTEKGARTSPARELDTLTPPLVKKEASPPAKLKGSVSPKEEKDSQNLREREMKKKLMEELTKEIKPARKEDKEMVSVAKEMPLWDKHELATNLTNRTCAGQASTSQSSNSHCFTERLVVRMDLVFLLGHHGDHWSAYQNVPTWIFTWLLHVGCLVLTLAVLASFIVGTLAPLAPSTASGRPSGSSMRGGQQGRERLAGFSNQENSSLQGTSPRSSLGRSRSSGGEKGGLNGLKNIGNTCFMNSVLQCLSNTKPLLEYLLNEDYLSDINFTISAMKGSLIKAFSNVIQELWAPNTEDRIINTTNFKSQIQKFAPRFMGYAQQDAQEFLRYLLEGLHEDVNRVTVKPQQILSDIEDSLSDNQKATEAWKRYLRMDDSKVVDIFVGQLKSTLQCTVCGHCSVTFDPFWDLSLPLPSRTAQPRLSSCLDAFTKEEVLDGEEKPTCSKCDTRRKCTKSFSIQKFPKILVLHLKRFSPTERYRGKLSITVDFPLTGLDLSPYAANKGQGCTYNLYAISNHSGTAYGGHYTAYCKHPYTGNWHEYNDSRVSSLSSRSLVSGEAYVLFYELATQTSHL